MKMAERIAGELEAGRRCVLVSVVEQSDSAPRHEGSCMLVCGGRLAAGTIGGGLLEAQAIAAAATCGDGAFFTEISLSGSDAASSDMICGGRMRLFLAPLQSAPAVRRAFALLRDGLASGTDMLLLLPVQNIREAFCLPLGDAGRNSAADGLPVWAAAAAEGFCAEKTTGPRVLETSGGTVVALPARAPYALIILGGGHVAGALARAASAVGFAVTVVDDRAEYASRERHPDAVRVRTAPGFADCLQGLGVSRHTFIAVMTRGHSHDRTALAQALGTGAGWIGMIGSRRKTAMVFEQLERDGADRAALARVTAPVGIDIGAETPEEIAVSITAQIIAARALISGNARHLDAALAGKCACSGS